ncbi:MAG: class II glutamine amidotransferase [Rhizobiaceae bacterium]
MCRWVAYRGEPVFISDLVTAPSNSLIVQSHAAQECKTRINGDGFGLAWYGEREEPGLYRDVLPAWSDCNLKSLTSQIRSPLFMAHIRASTGSATSRQNCHPFACGKWSFMHNGQIGNFERVRRCLETQLDDAFYAQRAGSTDSEFLFLLMMQLAGEQRGEQVGEPDVAQAMGKAVDIVISACRQTGIDPLVRLTAALSDGRSVYGFRYSSDAICPTLYLGQTGDNGVCLVSEPLDGESARWQSIPPGSIVEITPDGLSQIRDFPASA